MTKIARNTVAWSKLTIIAPMMDGLSPQQLQIGKIHDAMRDITDICRRRLIDNNTSRISCVVLGVVLGQTCTANEQYIAWRYWSHSWWVWLYYLLGYSASPFFRHSCIQSLLHCTTVEILRGGGDVRNLKHLKPKFTQIKNNLTAYFSVALEKNL